MTIATSDFASLGTYYGVATVIDHPDVELDFAIDVRDNDGIRFYYENNNEFDEINDNVIISKGYANETLSWTLSSNTGADIYTTTTLTLGAKKLRIKYFTDTKIFQIAWGYTTPVTGTSGETGKVYRMYMTDATYLSPVGNPAAPRSRGSLSLFKIIFFIIAAIVAIVAAIFAGIYVNRYIFFS